MSTTKINKEILMKQVFNTKVIILQNAMLTTNVITKIPENINHLTE